MENRCTIFERFIMNIKRYKDIFCILNKDEEITSNNVLHKLENLEGNSGPEGIVDLETVTFDVISQMGTIYRGTLLHAAVSSGYKKIVKALLEYGADIEAKCAKGLTPLHYAVLHGEAEITELLINENANVNAVDLKEYTPLHIAAVRGSPTLVKLLLSAGAEVNVSDRHCNMPLHYVVNCSVARKAMKTVRTLVNYGADVNAKDGSGNTVLHMTIVKVDIIAVLKEFLTLNEETLRRHPKIVKLNKSKDTESKDTENVVEHLLKHGAGPGVRNFCGNMVLHYSIYCSSVKVIKLLARYGADVNARDFMWRVPLYCLVLRLPFSRVEVSHIVYTFIRKGADINARNRNGLPTLEAIIKSNGELAKIVIIWAIIDNPAREKPSYLRNYSEFSALWDSLLRFVTREQERLSAEVEHKAIFDLLRTKNLNKLASLVNEENVLSKLNYCGILFPAHAHEIIYKYEKGWKRFKLLKMSEDCIQKLYQFATNSASFLPKEIVRGIAYYLTNKEIKNLITAVQCSGHPKRKLKFK